jgi:hypothetical protein
MDKSRLRTELAIQTALQYYWKSPADLTGPEQLAMTLMSEISRLEEGIVEVLEDSPIDREKLVSLLYRNR